MMRWTCRSRGARRFAQDQRGIALVEFAFVLPFLVLLFIGGFQLMDAISAYRKVGNTVRTLADLTTQNTTITASQADEILAASQQVMAPYSPASAILRITQVQFDAAGTATVSWSRALNGTPYVTGSAFIAPPQIVQAGRYVVYSEIYYTYTPRIASTLIGTIPLSQTIYMSPRNSAFIAYN
jgi:Flp pilus assembly protein TadG|uniref:TadE/TadG family type IV pilus assembly protein n=1 Tax=Sphingomonas sp. TaxID=28214 RepID=UPI0025F2233A|nr:TadE/TadG family type IV pilus assembly protein [Sphingomonas sp.]